MTDAEIEQERQRIDPPHEPLYVDSRASERQAALVHFLLASEWLSSLGRDVLVIAVGGGLDKYKGQGTLLAPFVTVEEARAVQKPGQSIVIAGYATIGAASKPPVIPQEIKERCS